MNRKNKLYIIYVSFCNYYKGCYDFIFQLKY